MAGRTRVRGATGSGRHLNPTGALVASSMNYQGNEAPRIYGGDKGWQQECYRFYGIIGEARFAANYYGAAMGKCEMFCTSPTVSEDGATVAWNTSYNSDEALALDDMFSGRNNQGQALRDIGIHLTVGGECFILGKSNQPGVITTLGDGSMTWEIASPLEMSVHGTGWSQMVPGTAEQYVFTADDVVIRLWRADPYRRNQADSPFKSLMPVLAEIEDFDKHIRSQNESRLAGAGILFVPEGMDFPTEAPVEGQEVETANGPSRLMKLIAKTGETAMTNKGHAAQRVPIIIQAPNELIDKIKLLHFWSPLDEKAGEMRSGSIHRFASGMDLPNESVEGMSSNSGTGGGTSNGVSHWGSWQIEESSIKMHIEPAMDMVVAAITIDWIRVQIPGTVSKVAYSAASLKIRPDRSKEAMELYALGLLSEAALLRENGFDVADLPTDDQRKTWFYRKVASGSNTPEQVAAAAKALGYNLPSGDGGEVANEAPAAPSLVEHPTRPRDPSEQPSAALIPVCNAMVLNALTRVGNRLMNLKAGKIVPPEGVATYAVHTFAVADLDVDRLLADAFPMANEMLSGIADPADVMPALQRYTAALVSGKGEHDCSEMAKWLEAAS